MIKVSVQTDDFRPGDALAALELPGAGGVATFTGRVRADNGLVALVLEHYPAMTDVSLRKLAELAVERWQLMGATIIHRFGRMVPGDRIVFVGTAAAHRAEALDACAFLIDRLKTEAPFWKQEIFADGLSRWVEAKASDDAAAARW